MSDQRLAVVVADKRPLAEGIMGFTLRAAQGGELPPFEAGAHVDVELPSGALRQYSLCNDPAERDHYELGILLELDGRGGSRSAHEDLRPGDHLHISPPRNHFPLEREAPYSLLLAGGIGITPLLAMTATLQRERRDFDLHYCVRSAARAAFLDRLADAAWIGRVHTHFDDGPAAQRFDATAALSAAPPGAHLYVCGPGGFMEHVLATARDLGWPEERLHREYFAAAPAEQSAGDSFEVEIASTGQCVTVPAEQSVADALIAAGIPVNLSCEQGICGSCALRVLDGEPDHRDMHFSAEEHAAGLGFTPCCSRAHSARLVLDFMETA